MAKGGTTNITGGGGIGSDEVTVTADKVIEGYTYVGADTDDEIGLGTMIDNGNTANQTLNASGSFTVKKGYHNQAFSVIANSLAGQTSATATSAQILNGQTAWVNGSKITGAMTNRGAVTSTLNAGGNYTIPVGYHNGSGKVTVNSLSSQTSATATASRIISGYTAWVNGTKITGTATDYSYLASGQVAF